jgi:hypothetical protein
MTQTRATLEYKALKDITDKYLSYADEKSSLGRTIRYWWKGHFYNGEFQDTKYQPFIKLIDRIALIDSSQLTKLNKLSPSCDNLFDILYPIFSTIQKNYQDNLTAQDTEYKNELGKHYDQQVVEDAYNNDVLDITNETIPPLRLAYDLTFIRRARAARKNLIHAQLKALKKDIHCLAEQLQQPTKIRKITPANPESDYDVFPDDVSDLIKQKKRNARQIKQINKNIAWWSALLIGFGEGLVAVAGMAIFPWFPFWAALLFVGTAGWLCNFFLFKNDTIDVLNEVTLTRKLAQDQDKDATRISLDKNNQPISLPKKIAIGIFGSLSIATGFVCGALSLFSCQSAFINLFSFLGTTGSYAIAALPAIATAIGTACIFFKVISDFIKNERWNDIGTFFKTAFYAPLSVMTRWERARHILWQCPIELLKLAFALTIAVVVSIASFGMFYQQGLNLMSKITGFAAASSLAYTASSINNISAIPFVIERTTFSPTKNTLIPLPVKTAKASPLLEDANDAQKITCGITFFGVALNGGAMGGLNAIYAPPALPASLVFVTATAGSATPNAKAVIAATDQNTVYPTQTIEESMPPRLG